MTSQSEEKVFHLDWLKWLLALALVALAVWGNSHYAVAYSGWKRAIILVVLLVPLFGLVYNTAKGYSIWEMLQGALVELRKVVWPSRQETNQTTLIVLVVVFITALILWIIDSGLGFITSKIVG